METSTTSPSKSKTIKSIYFYLVSFVALMMIAFSSADLINTTLKTWVFTKADDYYMYSSKTNCQALPAPTTNPGTTTPTKEQVIADCEQQNEIITKEQEANRTATRQNSIIRDISMIVVGAPLFLIHWRIVRSKDENL